MQRLLVIINPISGRSSKTKIAKRIIKSLDLMKYDVTIRFTDHPGHATSLASEAVSDGFNVVVAVGGDGTVNEVARALVGTDTALGIIPCGSGNGLARHLRIPMKTRKAIEIINTGEVDAIDVMTVNGQYCFCTAGVGYDAKVTAEYAQEAKRGLVTYARKALRGWFKYEPEEYTIELDNQVLKRKAVSITCANANQWGNEFYVAPKASLKDGLIDVTIINPMKLHNALLMPAQMLSRTLEKNPDVETFRSSSVDIKMDKVNTLHIDGEPIEAKEEVSVGIRRNCLSVILKAGNLT